MWTVGRSDVALGVAWHCRCEPVARLVARGHDEGAQGASACGRCQNRCAPLAPQALETGDFGIVVPIVFISLCMVLHRPGGLCSDGGYHFGGYFQFGKIPPSGVTAVASVPLFKQRRHTAKP